MHVILDLVLLNTEVRTGEQGEKVKENSSVDMIRAVKRSWLFKAPSASLAGIMGTRIAEYMVKIVKLKVGNEAPIKEAVKARDEDLSRIL